MAWFDQLKAALPGYYRPNRPPDIVGYLRGSAMPIVWRQMEQGPSPRHQMIILGNAEPSREEWIAAGVEQRGATQEIRTAALNGLIILYGGFMIRPWGAIHSFSTDALTIGFPASLASWRRNYMPPRP